ncbi:MAG: GGDEF domain-containing protein [Microthrixaceae bacterium]|nr:GGDEF domain-containing protein [Microthrixaceae bacterium]
MALDDVTDRRRLESQLAHRATHDPLTELPNRALLEDRLAQAAARLGRTGEEVAVLFCDLDDFKEVNDRFGHVVGDEVLVEVGRRIGSVLRPADTVARYGGDEFVVVCEGTGAEAAAEVAQRITAALAEPFAGAGGGRLEAGLRVSVGVAASDDPAVDPGDLLLRADQDMYRVKQAGDGASS